MIEILLDNIDNFGLATAGVIAYFGGRKLKAIELKKQKIAAKEQEAGALSSMQSAYNEFVIDYKTQYDEMKAQSIHCREEIKLLRTQSDNLKEEVSRWVNKHNGIRREFSAYKKKHN